MASVLRLVCRIAIVGAALIDPRDVLAETKHPLDLPPKTTIDAIFSQGPEPAPIAMPKRIVGATADPLCGLVPAKLDVTRGDTTRTYGMLVDATDKEPFSPTQVFLRVSRFTVDADGSSRAYHPDDPLGVGVCEPGKQGACALDRLSSADIAIYRGSAKIEPQDTVEKSGEYLAAWANAWSLITKNPAASLNHQTDPRIPEDFALYYFKDADLTVVFKTSIIPFRKGVPCTRGPKLADPGYFVAATSLQKTKVTPDNICDPSHYVDASKVPFVVLPGDIFGNVHKGDIAVGFAEPSADRKPVFAIIGDIGPPFKTSEGSIAFNSAMLGRTAPLSNSTQQGDIDIDLNGNVTAMGFLILGGTANALKGDFSADNIAQVGQQFLKRWSANREPTKRLADCLKAAPLNSWKE